jgi:hypothetical protein
MTKSQAAGIRLIWEEPADHIPCEHLNLEFEWDDLGHSTGNYVCIRCGVSVAHGTQPRNISTSSCTVNGAFP